MAFHFIMDYVRIEDLSRLFYLLFGIIPLTLGQMCSCIDSGNCDFTHQCVPEGACVKENVALGRVANISSLNINSGPACLAVNGNTTGANSTKNCVQSSDEENYPSWTVDLGRDYTITNLTIYPVSSYIIGLRGVEITVDGRFCYYFPNGPDINYGAREDVQCAEPQRGRIVKLYSSANYYLFFCELQVWVCIDGYYGNDCGFRCGNCLGEVCDKINGTCPSGCEAGWQNNYCNQECDDGYYGLSCNHTCGKCANFNICNKTSGVCPGGCDSGWTTSYCNQTCANGTYGNNCSHICGNCTNGESCDKVSGTCLTCEPGLKPFLCQQACDNGTYGKHCSGICGNCANGEPCDKVSGACLTCEPGLKPSLCQQVCDNGTYGQNCSSLCGNCTNSEACDKIKGFCLSCKPGLKPPLCQQACDFGTYGQNCSSLCGHCTNGEPCDNVNGECISCEPGMKPHLCQQTCDNFMYGLNCSNNCGKCTNGEPCDKVNGMCLSCDLGWQLPLCQQEVVTSEISGNTIGAIVGSILGGFAILGIIIAAPLVIYLRRLKSRSSDSRTKTSTELQPTSACDNFKYGLNCSNNCGKCTNGEPCDKVNGMCLSCEPGWQIPLCQQVAVTSENSGNTVGAIVGAILGGFAILGIIIAVPLILYLRRSKSRSSESRTTTNTELQPTSDKSANIKSPTLVDSANVESGNVESANVESANEYDEIENHYNSLRPIDQSEQHNYILPAFEERNDRPVKDKPVYVNTSTSDISFNS